MIGAMALRERGGTLLGQMGGKRLSWIHTPRQAYRPLFAVMFIQNVQNSYYNDQWLADPLRGVKRERWNQDVEDYEEIAAQMTEDHWDRLIILLVHCEMFHDHDLWALWPPNEDGSTPYPSHINPADSVVMKWRPGFEVFRLTLEESGSPVYPQLIYYEATDGVWEYLQPALPDWLDRSRDELRLDVETHRINGQQWVRWMIEILGRVL